MLEQAQMLENKELAEALLRNAEEQNKKFNIERISDSEYKLVKPRIEEINILLDGQKAN